MSRPLIQSVEASPLAVPFIRPFATASGPRDRGEHVIIHITAEDGTEGWGEASPVSTIYDETQGGVVAAVRGKLGPALIGLPADDLNLALDRLERALPGNRIAKAGVDLALHDLWGKRLGRPLVELWGGRRARDEPALEHDVSLDAPEAMAREAADAAARGVAVFELKVGGAPDEDLRRIKAVREATGPSARLRIDANEGWSRADAARILSALSPNDIDYVEQPLARHDVAGLAELRRRFPLPVCADQSVYDAPSLAAVLTAGAADLVCLKPSRYGLAMARRLAATAGAFGTPCVLGSMLPLGIGAAALHRFAVSAENIALARSGLYADPRDFHVDDVVATSDPAAPGLGIEIDLAKLDRWRVAA